MVVPADASRTRSRTPTRQVTGLALSKLPKISFSPKPRAVIGCLQIATDMVLDREGPLMIQRFPGVELRMQKIKLDSEEISADTFKRAASGVTDAVAVMMPVERFTAIGISCTAMSFSLGPEAVDACILKAAPAAKVTDMARGQMQALKALGAKRVALVTPYIEDVSAANQRMLESGGFEVVARATMNLDRDELTTAVSPECISDWVMATLATAPNADTVVVGCSAFRACDPDFIDELEKRCGKPVVTSTQAFLWTMLRTAGVTDKIKGYGRLLATC